MRSHTDPITENALSDSMRLPVKTENYSGNRDPLYLLVCYLEWRTQRSLRAYKELIAALDDRNEDVRSVAARLLSPRFSPHPPHDSEDSEDEAW